MLRVSVKMRWAWGYVLGYVCFLEFSYVCIYYSFTYLVS